MVKIRRTSQYSKYRQEGVEWIVTGGIWYEVEDGARLRVSFNIFILYQRRLEGDGRGFMGFTEGSIKGVW